MRRLLPVALLGVGSMLLVACDTFVDFSVVNDSSLELVVRVSEEPCGDSSLNKNDILVEGRVSAFRKFEYGDVTGSFDGRCVQIYTEDGDLVLAEEYEYSASYRVPARPLVIGHVEKTESLPNQGWWDGTKEEWSRHGVELLLLIGSALFFTAGIAYGLVLAVKALLPRKQSSGE